MRKQRVKSDKKLKKLIFDGGVTYDGKALFEFAVEFNTHHETIMQVLPMLVEMVKHKRAKDMPAEDEAGAKRGR